MALCILFTGASFFSKGQLRANFTATPVSGCAPLVVNFTDASTGNPTSWAWNLGNGTTSVLQNPATTYFDPGTYTVILTVKNALGTDEITKVQYITVYSSPVVNFTASKTAGCFPLSTNFTDQSVAGNGTITKWEWDFGDGNSSLAQNPNHVYTSAGNFNVSLRVTNSFGCVTSKTFPSFIQISDGTKAQFTNSTPNTCQPPATINFTNNSTGSSALSYLWNFGDGSSSTLANPNHIYNTSGSFTVSLIVTNATGCSDTITKANLISLGTTKADFSVPASICQGTAFNISNTSTPTPGSASWDFGDGTFSNLLNPTKTYNSPGNYTIKMVANFGACQGVVSKTVQVTAAPVVNFSATPTVSCKAPLTVNFTDLSNGGASFAWDFGDGSTSTLQNPSHTYMAPGTYSVKLSVTNAAGCTDTLVKQGFIAISTPVVSINGLPQKGCVPLTHTFNATVNSIDPVTTYQWNFEDGNTSSLASPNYTYNTPGSYTVTLIYTTASGCEDSVKFVNGILAGSKPKANFSANPLDACAVQNITFTDQTTGNPNEWFWYFGDGSSSQIQNPVHQYNDTGYFTITLIALNNGCADTITLPNYVHIQPPVARFSWANTCAAPTHVVFTDLSIGADTWQWDFGDGATSTLTNPSHDYSLPGVYSVALTVTNAKTGCKFTQTNTVKVIREIADFVIGNIDICKKMPVTFTAVNSIPGNIVSYTWAFGDGITITTATNSVIHSYAITGNFNVTLTLTDINGCSNSVTKPLAIQVSGPTANFGSTVNAICSNSSLSFIDQSTSDGTHPIRQWNWTWGDGTSQTYTAPPFSHTYSSPGNFTVTLQVTDSKGCIDFITKPNAIVVSKPVAQFSAQTLSCTTGPVIFNNLSSGPGLTFLWDFGDGTTSRQQNPVHLYTVEGSYTISLTVTDMYGCVSSVSKTNYVKIANPQALFTVNDSIGNCPPLVVAFTNSSLNYTTLLWDFGDGTSSTSANPSHFYSTVGTFIATLTISGPAGCTSQVSKQIKVLGPTGTFSYTNRSGCAPLQTMFSAHTTGKPTSFVWDFNDGNTVTTPDSVISHTYSSPGKYLPKMILSDAAGCHVPITAKDTIQVYGVTASFTHTGALLCDSGTVQFTNTSSNNDIIVGYLWNFDDGTTSTLPNPLHGYNRPGNYNTSLVVTTRNGCMDSAKNSVPVKIIPSPKISIAGNAGACVPAVLTFSGILSNPDTSVVSWKWDLANGNISTLQNPPAQTYSSAGTFYVKATATNSSGCKDTAIKPIEIYPLPKLTVTSNPEICFGSTVQLQAGGAQSYAWSPGTYLSCTNCASPVSKPDSSINYKVVGTSDKGCVARDSVSVIVKQPFKLSLSKGDSLCQGKSIQLQASGGEIYTWKPSTGLNNPSIASPIASPLTTTTYQVIATDTKGCFKDTGYIPIDVFPLPKVNAGPDKTINIGGQTDIIPQISNDVTNVLWSPPTGILSYNYPGITVKPTESIEYTIEVTNIGGCKARDKISIFVLCNNANIFVPNTFSPNGDGVNDIFYPRGSGIFKIKNMKVFDRWGEIVFERSNFNANDALAGWDGTFKGKKLPPDVFVYVLEVVCENNANLVFKGNIALIK